MAGPGDKTHSRLLMVGGLALVAFAGCSFLTTRPGTDPAFFSKLDSSSQSSVHGQFGQSPSFFTRQMTEAGASCGDGRRNGKTVRVVCVYAICLNGGANLSAWQMDVGKGTISRLKQAQYGEPGQGVCDHRKPDKLKDIQQAVVKEQILSAGEEVL